MFISFVVVGFIVELYGLQDFFTFLLANHVSREELKISEKQKATA